MPGGKPSVGHQRSRFMDFGSRLIHLYTIVDYLKQQYRNSYFCESEALVCED